MMGTFGIKRVYSLYIRRCYKIVDMLKLVVFVSLGGLSLIFGSSFNQHPDPVKERVIQSAVLGILEQYHYHPEDLDDEFSIGVYDQFLEYLDSRKRFFTQEDLHKLSHFRFQIDDQIQNNSFEFFDLVTDILDDRVEETDDIFEDILASPFDFTISESVEFDTDKKDWVENDAALVDRWRKLLKYDVLNKLTSRIKKQNEAKEEDDETKEKSISDLEAESRDKVLDDYNRWYKRYMKLRRSDRFETYINAIAHQFDPHSDYYNPKEKEEFDIKMGGKLEGIGARLQADGDLTKVVHVVPGGPVWKDKQIEVNDFITAVAQKGENAVDVFGMRLDDVVSMIRGKKGTHVVLTVKKSDGTTIQVQLERDVINTEETFAKSAILDYDGLIDNIGYIDLPKFYSSFEGAAGNSCAADVATEIANLKSQNINGLILDLRSNGGGSLKDVVDMSGLFIEDGPIVQVKPRERRPYIYKDEDAGVKYDGPLIVLVNSYSASASEILAAAIQDYDRGLVVGSQSYGKGTVQKFIDLDRVVRGNQEYKPLGQVKLTMQKFYRINGGSTQLKGVTPDITLPGRYDKIDIGEREYDNALDWSQLSELDYEQNVYTVGKKDLLKSSSSKRINSNKDFQLIIDQSNWIKESRKKTLYSLNLEDHMVYQAFKKKRTDKFKSLMDESIEGLSVSNLPQDEKDINLDETTIASNEEWVSALSKDIYVGEALAIMRDLIDVGSITSLEKKN